MKQRKRTLFIVQAALIAALYVVLTHISNAVGLANGAVQVRISEALTILPFFMPSAVIGVPLGCLISNITTGCVIWDIIFGTFATLLGAIGTYFIGKLKFKWSIFAAPIPPIAANTVIIPFVLRYAYGVGDAMWFLFLTLFAGEFISCGILGVLFYGILHKTHLDRRAGVANEPASEPAKEDVQKCEKPATNLPAAPKRITNIDDELTALENMISVGNITGAEIKKDELILSDICYVIFSVPQRDRFMQSRILLIEKAAATECR